MLLLKKAISAIAIIVPLGIYILALQWSYEEIIPHGHSLKAAALFLAELFLGAATYDFVKKTLLMPDVVFHEFWSNFVAAWIALLGMALLVAFSAICFQFSERTFWIGALTYCAAIFLVPVFISRLTTAIDTAVKAN